MADERPHEPSDVEDYYTPTLNPGFAVQPPVTGASQLPPDLANTFANLIAPPPAAPAAQSSSASITMGQPVATADPTNKAARGKAMTDAGVAALQKLTPNAQAEGQATAQKYDSIQSELQSRLAGPNSDVARITEEHLKPLEAEFKQAETDYKAGLKARDEIRSQIQNGIGEMDRLSKSIASEQPHDIWAEAGLGTRIAAIALSGLGAAAQSFYGEKSNPVTDQIDAAIKRDLLMQKMRMEKNKGDYANKNLLLNQLSGHFSRGEHADDAAYLTAMHGLTGRLQVIQGMLKDPQMRQAAALQIAALQQRMVDATNRHMTNINGEAIRAEQAVAATGAKLETAKTGLENTRASVAQARLDKDLRALTAPNVEGSFTQPQLAKEYIEQEGIASNLIDGLSQMKELVRRRDLSSLNDKARWNQLAATMDLLAKGKDVYNLGAALTGLEAEKLRKAMSTGDFTYIMNDIGAERLQDAINQIAHTVETRMKASGVRPTKTHPFLSPE